MVHIHLILAGMILLTSLHRGPVMLCNTWVIARRVGGGVSKWGFPVRIVRELVAMDRVSMDRAAEGRTTQVSQTMRGGF